MPVYLPTCLPAYVVNNLFYVQVESPHSLLLLLLLPLYYCYRDGFVVVAVVGILSDCSMLQ